MDFALDALDTKTAAEEGRWMTIRQFDGEPLVNAKGRPVRLLLAGIDSLAYRIAQRVMVRERMEQGVKDEEAKYKPDDMEELRRADTAAAKMMAACVLGWDGVLDTKEKELPFTAAGALAMIDRYPPVRDQADRFISGRANFTKASSEG